MIDRQPVALGRSPPRDSCRTLLLGVYACDARVACNPEYPIRDMLSGGMAVDAEPDLSLVGWFPVWPDPRPVPVAAVWREAHWPLRHQCDRVRFPVHVLVLDNCVSGLEAKVARLAGVGVRAKEPSYGVRGDPYIDRGSGVLAARIGRTTGAPIGENDSHFDWPLRPISGRVTQGTVLRCDCPTGTEEWAREDAPSASGPSGEWFDLSPCTLALRAE